MRRKIFIRFFSVTLISTLLMFVFGIFSVMYNTERAVSERLIEETKMVSLLLKDESSFEKFKEYEGNDNFRITVFDLDGNVLVESDTPSELGNHKDREEIKNALANEPKTVKRYSETLGCEMTYYAQKTELENGTEVILRLALKSSEVSSYFNFALPLLIIVLVIALVLSFIISHFISISISSRVEAVGHSLKSIRRGEYMPISADATEPELYGVLREINRLNESTHEHIKEIEGEHKKLNRVLENISQGIIAIDNLQEIAFVNKSLRNMFSCEGDPVGKGVSYVFDDLGLLSKISSHIFENYSFEYKYKDKDLNVEIHELAKDELTISSVIIITDITSEKEIQKQKSDFFANASHELKTPVTVMQGLSELVLADDKLPTELRGRVDRINKESVRLATLISDMLKLTRLEGGAFAEESLSNVDMREIANEVGDELSEQISKKNIEIKIDGTATVKADAKRIYELISNLVSNAINYNKENGKIFVTMSENDNFSTLVVKDTGIGIDKSHIPMLCQRFYRVDKSRSKKTGGTGLGLAIVKHICALYNAELSIESELGVGTQFTVIFKK